MLTKIDREIKKWVIEAFQNTSVITSFEYEFNEKRNLCRVEIQWYPLTRGEHPILIAQYEGLFDESFLIKARLHIEKQIAYRVMCLAPQLNHLFFHLLN